LSGQGRRIGGGRSRTGHRGTHNGALISTLS
jgi:hypothetical protein